MERYCNVCWQSPVGVIEISGTDKYITSLQFTDFFTPPPDDVPELFTRCIRELEEYFRHERTEFDIPYKQKGSAFEQAVWKALAQIPYGTTTSYRAIAEMSGNVRATRAVGNACNKNQLLILVPCHRVVGQKDLTGYNGGRLRKEFLLNREASKPVQLILF